MFEKAIELRPLDVSSYINKGLILKILNRDSS